MTSVHPDLSVPGNEQLWARAEAAWRHVLAGLMRRGWFGPDDTGRRRDFHMPAEATATGAVDVPKARPRGW